MITREIQQIDGVRRRSFLRSGVLLGAATVGLTTASSVAFTGEARAASQGAWWWCKNCALIFHSGNALNGGNCPKGGNVNTPVPHDLSQSSIYKFDYGNSNVGYGAQPDWAWCNLCQVLFFGPDVSGSACPGSVSSEHNIGSGTNYDVCNANPNHSSYKFQSGWNFCYNCKGLFHGSGNPAGTCQKVIGKHQPLSSTYWVAFFTG